MSRKCFLLFSNIIANIIIGFASQPSVKFIVRVIITSLNRFLRFSFNYSPNYVRGLTIIHILASLVGIGDTNMDLKRLKAERTQLRRIFSKEVTKFEKLFAEENIDIKTVRSDFIKLEDKAQRLFKLDGDVYDLLFASEELTEAEITEEVDKTEEYRDLFLSMVGFKEQLEALISAPAAPVSEIDNVSLKSNSIQSVSNKHNLKLPKLDPKKFDGNLKEWISFWTIFKRIHESNEFDSETKFQYLLLYTTEGSPARQLVESFPPSSGNYQKAIDQLKQRFGREELLVELYSREILKLVLLQAKGEEKLPLRTLYDRLETQIRALETLGMRSDKFSYLLTPLVESALPDLVLKDWERHSVTQLPVSATPDAEETPEEVDKLRLLLNFVKLEVESEERLSLARGTFAPVSKPSSTKGNCESKYKNKVKVATAADLVNIKPSKNSSCIFCSDDVSHASADCFKARARSLEEIQTLMKERGCCFLCMRRGHNKIKCKVFLKCIICEGRHVPLLCPSRNTMDSKETGEEPVTHHSLANTSNQLVIMQTLLVRLRGFPDMTARVLFDSGSQRSYITKRLASKLNYTPTDKVTLEHALFGGSVSDAKTHACYKVHVVSMDRRYSCNFDVLDSEEICHAIPSVPMSNFISELRKHDISLSDREGGPIDILIGADIAGKLITGKRVVLNNGLVAFHTHLGWTLMGKIPQPCSQYMSNISLFTVDVSAQNLWKLETIGIEDSAEVLTREQKALAAKEYFLDTVRILDDGRYQVRLPWREDHPPLQRNFNLALKRWESTSRKLKTTDSEAAYADVLTDWQTFWYYRGGTWG
uniref:Uncharacterized protein n=1 Tax=Lygus hesperus TaxID=30085 RepID=A0A0K8SHJ7_LYGHE